jgi:hypothetical protein
MEALADLDSPAKLLELLAKCKESGEQPPLQASSFQPLRCVGAPGSPFN